MDGIFSLMLHSHIPYCRKSGTWPAGEEWLFEAMYETYIPLLSVFRRFQRDNIHPNIMFGVVPILAEQLSDKYMNDRFCEYMEDKIRKTEKDIERFKGDSKRLIVAKFLNKKFSDIFNAYKHDFYANIVGSLKWLQEEKIIEILTSAATHGFLPLMENDSGIYSQIHLGVKSFENHFGTSPKGFWLPECAYRPRQWSNNKNKERRAIDEWLADEKIKYFFVENIGIENAEFIENKNNESKPTTYRGYKLESGVTVFGRNISTSKQVWSPEYGYPGDINYREFHKKDLESGLHYWKITGKPNKEIYNYTKALEIVKSQSNDFTDLIKNILNEKKKKMGDIPPIIVSPYDCELFGHWWFEGPQWIENVYRKFSTIKEIKTISLSQFVDENINNFSTIRMKPSTWGENGDFTVWNNPEHAWLWPYINSSMKNFEEVLKIIKKSGRVLNKRDNRILKQIGRELLLLEGSDWPFLLYTKQAKDYANQRFHHHHQRFNKLIWAAKNLDDLNRISDNELLKIESIDNPWQNIDIKMFNQI